MVARRAQRSVPTLTLCFPRVTATRMCGIVGPGERFWIGVVRRDERRGGRLTQPVPLCYSVLPSVGLGVHNLEKLIGGWLHQRNSTPRLGA